MIRIAHCSCGSLRAKATGEPALLGVCHCAECQRRTGSAFGVGTYFPREQVRAEGPSKVYVRGSDSGRKIEQHFCPECGSTVFWYNSEAFPDLIGIAFGAFADPSMPWPPVSVWETTRHPWVTFNHELLHFERGRPHQTFRRVDWSKDLSRPTGERSGRAGGDSTARDP